MQQLPLTRRIRDKRAIVAIVGVGPYYLTHEAEIVGYHAQVILAGRHVNDGMTHFVAEMAVKQLGRSGFPVRGSKATVPGLTFKEDCPDLRDSTVAELCGADLEVHVRDPVSDSNKAEHEYGVKLKQWAELPVSKPIALAVPHRELVSRAIRDYAARATRGAVFTDVKSRLDPGTLASAGFAIWRL